MGKIELENIWERGFKDPEMLKVEAECRKNTSENTDRLIEEYKNLEQARNGNYVSSDLMKMVFPFYKNDIENRRKYNLAVSNSAACLANEAYRRQVENPQIKRCIFVAGPYGAGKSFLIQSLYEKHEEQLDDCVVYEGSITTKSIDGKIDYALAHNLKVDIVVINPTFELSLKNIKERAGRIGRDVKREDASTVYANIYQALNRLLSKYQDINYVIYNKENNIPTDLSVSTNIEDLNHGSYEEVLNEYDNITKNI